MRMHARGSLLCLWGLALWVPACFDFKTDDADADAGIMSGARLGERCANLADCRSGLTCSPETGTCVAPGNKIEGAYCMLSAECMPGYYCTLERRCAAAGTGQPGDECADDGECASGLICAMSGLTGTCTKAGVVDLDGACTQPSDCLAGLSCMSGTCQSAAMAPTWAAVCPTEASAVPKALFAVPRTAAVSSVDFYRLPFPNDIRKKNGRISLEGHPRPGARFLTFDLVDRYLQAIEADSTGFGTNQATFLRFSVDIDMDSLGGRVDLIDITPSSPDYGNAQGCAWNADNGRSAYVCDHFMTVQPRYGHPLRPGTTYMVVVKRGVMAKSGVAMERDDDFAAMLGAQAPADPDLAAAWVAYAPLRAYLADSKLTTKLAEAELLVAAVFTTERLEDPLAGIEQALQAAPAPAISKLVRCGDPGVVSPCDDGKTGTEHERGCMAEANGAFDEYQGVINLPVFQKGKAPYEQPADGGGVELDATGVAQIQRSEDVCLALTVPKGAAPAAGWPLVVYSHGTGGSYRSAVEMGLAGELAAANVAVLGYDGALHANRKGESTKPVTELVYNFLNPRAARDNALQAAADLIAIPRGLDGLGSLKIDKAHVALYGHSQGGNAASLAAGRDAGYGAVVLSGTGGTLMFSLLEKTKPVNVPQLLPFLLGETSVNETHPVLNLMQMYFERSDTVNFARRLFDEPLESRRLKPQHALHIYGTGDTYAPVRTQQLFATAARFPLASPEVDGYFSAQGFTYETPPLKANRAFGRVGSVSAAMLQYAPAGYDGHFVSTSNPAARAAIQRFLTTFVSDDAPTIQP